MYPCCTFSARLPACCIPTDHSRSAYHLRFAFKANTGVGLIMRRCLHRQVTQTALPYRSSLLPFYYKLQPHLLRLPLITPGQRCQNFSDFIMYSPYDNLYMNM